MVLRGGEIDYQKWENLGDGSSEEVEKVSFDGRCRVRKLKRPSTVHIMGGDIVIEGDAEDELVEGRRAVRRFQRSPSDGSEAKINKIKCDSNQLSTHQQVEACDIPEFVAEDEFDMPQTQPMPLVSEWSKSSRRWNAIDYSKWDDVYLSEQSHDVDDKAVDDKLDVEVRRKFLYNLNKAILSKDEKSLSDVLKSADSFEHAGLIDSKDIEHGRQALLNMSRSRQDNSSSFTPISLNNGKQTTKCMHAELTRNGGRTESFFWSQTNDHVTLHIFVSDEVRGADLTLFVGPRLVSLKLHEPDLPCSSLFTSTAAEARRVKQVLFEAILARPVRYEDNETEWEVCSVPDTLPDGSITQRRAVRVCLTKKPPGEHFFRSTVPEWDPEYEDPGVWRGSLLRVWWSRVRPGDTPIDVTALPDRGGRAGVLQSAWHTAEEALRSGVNKLGPVDLSTLVEEDIVKAKLDGARSALQAECVPEGSLDWQERMCAAEAEAREEAQVTLRERAEVRQRVLDEQERLDEEWRISEANRRAARRAARRAKYGTEGGGNRDEGSSDEDSGWYKFGIAGIMGE